MHCRISYCSQSKSQPELRIHLLHHDRGFSLFRGVHVIASQNQNCFVTNSPLQSSHAETKANANLLLLVPVPSCSSFQLPQSVLMRSVLSQILHCKAAMQKLRAMPCQPASVGASYHAVALRFHKAIRRTVEKSPLELLTE